MNEEKPAKHRINDSVFTDLFKGEENLLKLYRVLHPEDTDVTRDDIENVTIENVLVNGIYNDLGFMVRKRQIILMEAQSTRTKNILVRALAYLAQTYSVYLEETGQNVYGTRKVSLPKPELYVLYTGEDAARTETISLAEEFFGGGDAPVDVRIKLLYGGAPCDRDILAQYVRFTQIYREKRKEYGRTRRAVTETIRVCENENVLTEYLGSRKKEVENIMLGLFDQEKIWKMYGIEQRTEGMAQGEAKMIIKFYNNGYTVEQIAKVADKTVDEIREIVENGGLPDSEE